MMMKNNITSRVFGLDFLRAFAILTVMLVHNLFLFNDETKELLIPYMIDGVSIFFVLSGFLIGGILIREFSISNLSPSKQIFIFWIKRWLRTLPNYWILLSFLMLITTNVKFQTINKWSYFFFTQNLTKAHPYFFTEAWSLAVEEWFYLLFPLVLSFFYFVLKVKFKRSIEICLFLFIAFPMLYKIVEYNNSGNLTFLDWDDLYRKQVLTRLDTIVFGVLGAYIFYYYNSVFFKYKNKFFYIGIFLFLITKLVEIYTRHHHVSFYFCTFYFWIESISVLLTLPFFYMFRINNSIIVYITTWLSKISYSMYLINLWFVQGLILKLPWNKNHKDIHVVDNSILFWFITIAISILMYHLIEKTFLRLRDRYIR